MRFQRPCIGNNGQPCPARALTSARNGRCSDCARAHWRAMPTSSERGYGAEHVALRRQWEPLVATGQVICWRCGRTILPDEPFDLGHDDTDRTQWRSPEHVSCNRAAGGRSRTR